MMIERKNWDSEFFGKVVGAVADEVVINSENFSLVQEAIDSGNFEFVYYFFKLGQSYHEERKTGLDIDALSKVGFKYIDTHLTMDLKLDSSSFGTLDSKTNDDGENEVNVVLVKQGEVDAEKLRIISYQLSFVSRYYLDEKVNLDKVHALYDAWVDNSLSGQLADYFYVIGRTDDPLGLVTYKKIAEDEVDLSILAVREDLRGQRYGEKLVTQSIDAILKEDSSISKCSVKVSLSNIVAVRFYEKLGFRVREVKQVYHFHK